MSKIFETFFESWGRIQAQLFTRLVARQFHEMGTGSRISPPFRFHNLRQMAIGNGVTVNRDCWFIALANDSDGEDPKLIIESHASIGMGATISAASRVVVGEYALLARNVYISDHGHAYKDVERPIAQQGIDNMKPVSIGRHSWLGQNACILAGAIVGEHCVIGANSVVVSNIPDYSIAVGAPARIVRTYNRTSKQWERI